MQSKFGDSVIPIVLAHEWGHAIQARSNFTVRTVTKELQADCFAGGWAKHAKDAGLYKVNAAEMDSALAGILVLRDSPGTSKIDTSAHGSGFDRVSAFQDGYDNGTSACKEYRDDSRVRRASVPERRRRGRRWRHALRRDGPRRALRHRGRWTHVYPELTNGEAWVPVRAWNRSTVEPADVRLDAGQGLCVVLLLPRRLHRVGQRRRDADGISQGWRIRGRDLAGSLRTGVAADDVVAHLLIDGLVAAR
ncbi:neutral zinc metallopeptidase [Mycolicibacterium helvum]|uniref:neutral zinc metallopeptidase n=1 Tax=Mycolicibacterium helvum TaxID=1534349 RepID=UPI001FE282CC|nr:neutral zinc metallopeptidase [Mycolicibacterium helvum]